MHATPILQYLKKHGQRRDLEIAAPPGASTRGTAHRRVGVDSGIAAAKSLRLEPRGLDLAAPERYFSGNKGAELGRAA